MPKDKPKPPDVPTPGEFAQRIHALYKPGSGAMGGQLNRLSRRLFALADKAGIQDARRLCYDQRHTVYLLACEKGLEESYEARDLRLAVEEIESHIQAFAELERRVERNAPKQTPPDLYDLTVECRSLGNLGLVPGDKCPVYLADGLKPGDAAAIELKGDDCVSGCGRVVTIDDRQITLRNDRETVSYDRSEIERVGRVDILNVSKVDPLTPGQRKRVNTLRQKLEDLDGEDDQILRCTARYKYEKEIFDIEHPLDMDGWSAWEDEEEGED